LASPPTTHGRSSPSYRLTREHDELRALVRQLADERIAPRAAEIDATSEYPWDLKQLLAEHDLLGTGFEERYGGTELDGIGQAIVVEEVARADATTSLIPIIQKLGALPIMLAGRHEQKERYFPRLASGEWLPAFALTEAGAGSDVASMRMRAARDGDEYVLNGTKRFITNAPHAGIFTVMARTDPAKKGASGVSAFAVERGVPGLSLGKPEKKLGQQGAHVCDVIFEDARIPADALIGGVEGVGFKTAMKVLDKGRLSIASVCVGLSERLVDDMVAYAIERKQFGQPIAEFQLIQAMLADSRAEAYAGRAMVLEAARRRDAGEDVGVEAACAKMFASEAVGRIADRNVQVHGGNGYIREYRAEQLFRDARLFRIYEGTTQIQQIIIARALVAQARDRAGL
jgi:acyl-CoA dehydrogenase